MNKLFALFIVSLLLFGCLGGQAPKNETVQSGTGAQATQPQAPVNTGGNTSAVSGLTAQNGDTVEVDYVGSLDDGTVFDTSVKAEAVKAGLGLRPSYAPLKFKVGSREMIAGFDAAVVGMKEGEEKTVHLLPTAAYGERNEEIVVSVPRAHVTGDVQVGSEIVNEDGINGIVVEVTNETVKMDFNHQLAGKALNFKIIMRKITKG